MLRVVRAEGTLATGPLARSALAAPTSALVALAAVLGCAVLAGCGGNQDSSTRIPLDARPLATVARQVRDLSHVRVTQVVDVTAGYPSRHGGVDGAVVLVDSRVGHEKPVRDFAHRPVLVRYASVGAARDAVAGLGPDRFSRVHATVLLLPARFPTEPGATYRAALLEAALPPGIPDLK